MDLDIQRKFCVYRMDGSNTLVTCPFDQRPPGCLVVHVGTQQGCEHFMRDISFYTRVGV